MEYPHGLDISLLGMKMETIIKIEGNQFKRKMKQKHIILNLVMGGVELDGINTDLTDMALSNHGSITKANLF